MHELILILIGFNLVNIAGFNIQLDYINYIRTRAQI
jgi:hypothetical protein